MVGVTLRLIRALNPHGRALHAVLEPYAAAPARTRASRLRSATQDRRRCVPGPAPLALELVRLGGAALRRRAARGTEAPLGLDAALAVSAVLAHEVAALRAVLELRGHDALAGAAHLEPLLGQVDDARHLVQRGDAAQRLVQAVLADRPHAALDRHVADLGLGRAAHDHAAHGVVHGEHLEDAGAAGEAGLTAGRAAGAAIERDGAVQPGAADLLQR